MKHLQIYLHNTFSNKYCPKPAVLVNIPLLRLVIVIIFCQYLTELIYPVYVAAAVFPIIPGGVVVCVRWM